MGWRLPNTPHGPSGRALLLALSAAALLLPTTSQATLIDMGSTTIDDQTGLQWVDLTETEGQSLKDFDEGVWAAAGYRLATLAEVVALFTGNGVAESNTLTVQERMDQFAAASAIVDLLGPMALIGGLHGFTDWVFIGGGNPVNDNYEAVTVDVTASGGLGDFTVNGTSGTSYQSTNSAVGIFIVRSVPEPTLAALGGLALLGLAVAQRVRIRG